MDSLTLTRPDDWHLHLRDGAALQTVAYFSARVFKRAIAMPNLQPPVTTVEQALAYRGRILDSLPPDSDFEPLMTLYLTDDTTPEEIARAAADSAVYAVKLYPAGATTHSDAGVTRMERVYGTLERMEAEGLPLLLHGEVTDPAVDIFDREARFLETVLEPLLARFSRLKVVLEHITTRAAVECVRHGPDRLAATITPQHVHWNRNALFNSGLQPHAYCLPVLKRERDREAVLEAAVSGHPRFFLGTDSAPHARDAKERACGCAGVFSAHAALPLYADIFERAGHLTRLEAFASHFGADFYGLPRNSEPITLKRQPWRVPEAYPFGADGQQVVPMLAGEVLQWRCLSRGAG